MATVIDDGVDGIDGARAGRQWLARHENELTGFRRRFHRNPELGRAEFETTKFIRAQLAGAGVQTSDFAGGTGLWCDIGSPSGKKVLVRADIDALPIQDEKTVAYRSQVPGACHACGHDAHTAIGLGLGLALAARHAADPLPGTVRIVFQPAEELTPAGALDVIAEGVADGADAAVALHCDPTLDVGAIGLRAGAITSAVDHVYVHLHGPGGHTSRPHLTVDLVHVAAHFAVTLPALLSRAVDPRFGFSLVWGKLTTGTTTNVIPREATIAGTIRTSSLEVWDRSQEMFEQAVTSLASTYGVEAAVEYRRGQPPTVNAEAVVQAMADAISEMADGTTKESAAQSLGADDFAHYLKRMPGAYARLGTRSPGGVTHDLHRGTFDIDERAIGVGAGFLLATVEKLLLQ